jgi:hypothetical protein
MTEQLFESAAQALTFAFNFSMQQYDRPLMNRLADGPGIRTGKGLSGLDGAGQAGIIRRHVAKLDALHQAVLVSRFAPPQLNCTCGRLCCSGKAPNLEWQAAIRILADYGERDALAGCSINRPLTLAMLRRLIGHKLQIVEMARTAAVAENTVTNQLSKLKNWFKGEGTRHNSSPPRLGAEPSAMLQIEYSLVQSGLVACTPAPTNVSVGV